MPYTYAPKNEVTEFNKFCLEIIHDVQKIVKEYFTLDIRLIGSGEKRLVTKDEDGCFDLDYNLIIQRDKKEILNNPKEVKTLFLNAFNKVMPNYVKNYIYPKNKTSVITSGIKFNSVNNITFDVAILAEGNNGYLYKLFYDKNVDRYIWNQVRNSKGCFERYQEVKEQGLFNQFKKRYLELKNMHLKRGDEIKSFSIFLETLNEVQ